jgi:hypothetical protein
MVRDVIMRHPLTKKPDVIQEIDVFTPVAVGELVPCPADFLAHLRKTLGWRKPVAGRGFLREVCRLTIPFRRDNPGILAFGKQRLRCRECHDVDVATFVTAVR